MITIRKSEDRGHARFGWLDSRHTFSFSSYHDPRFMGVSALRVINQDIVAPHTGFPAHPHDNMEILTYVLRGAVSHRDSMGNEQRLPAGEFQLMSAGTGVTHSEYNRDNQPLELLQIWLYPDAQNSEPGYQQKRFAETDGLQLVVSPDGENGSLVIRQDARIWHGSLSATATAHHTFTGGNGWVQVIGGQLHANGNLLQSGDGAAIRQEASLTFTALSNAEFLLFDLP
ncbi:MAG TPA: pirin family protein [Moraxellaceae bacterium]|nr:pirin family protein [Moraxellaceae bacterium]